MIMSRIYKSLMYLRVKAVQKVKQRKTAWKICTKIAGNYPPKIAGLITDGRVLASSHNQTSLIWRNDEYITAAAEDLEAHNSE